MVESLDDLLSPEQLSSLKVKRVAKARVDLSDLIERPKMTVELLPPIQVLFHVQTNTCQNCHQSVDFPLGLVAMHPIKRNGRLTSELAGVALLYANDHPSLPRSRAAVHSTSITCSSCVEEARFVPRAVYTPPRVPQLDTPEWAAQFGYGKAEEIHEREARLRAEEERIARELSEVESVATTIQAVAEIQTNLRVEEEPEITLHEDTQ